MTCVAFHVEDEFLLVYCPFYYVSHGEFIFYLGFFSQVNLLWFEVQLHWLFCWDRHRHRKWTFITYLQETILHLRQVQSFFLHLPEIFYHSVDQFFLIVFFGHPDRIRTKNFMLGTIW